MINKNAFSLIEISILVLIIAVLISSVSLGVDLYADFKISNAKTLTNNSIVNRIDDLALWVEPVSSSSFLSNVKDGDSINSWINIGLRVSSKYNIIPHTPIQNPSPTSVPIYKVNSINNLPALFFNGTSTCMEIDNKFDDNSENYTIFLLIKNSDNTGASLSILEKYRGGTDSAYPYSLRIHNNKYQFASFSNSNQNFIYSSASLKNDSINLVILSKSKESGKMKLFFNNYISPDSTDVTITSSTVTNRPLCVGCRCGDSSNVARFFYKFFLGELIIFKRELRDEERIKVYEYLVTKWGLKK
jgi:hypothetical protein